MSETTELYIPLVSSPIGALNAAQGLATWADDLARKLVGDMTEVPIEIANAGHAIVVRVHAAIDPGQVTMAHYSAPRPPWILTAKNGPPPQGLAVIEYEAERSHNSDYYNELKRLQKEKTQVSKLPSDQKARLEEMAPRLYWPVAAQINQMGAIGAYNKAVERWAACRPVYSELVAIILTMCSGRAGAVEQAQQDWETLAKKHPGLECNPFLPATQVVNPEQGKGANRPKADALTIGGRESFWLLEYFKYAGLYTTSLPRTVQGKKDRKTYVVMPAQDGIALRWHRDIFGQFQKEFWPSSAIKMDVLAALRYTATMLAQWEGAQRSTGRRRKLSDYVEGFAVVSYKDLGSALAVMNVATVGLPDWVVWPDTPEEANRLKGVVDEHQRLIGVLDEKKGEEEQLLRDYRDFLSSRDPGLHAFFAFTTGYASHILRRMSKGQRVRRLKTDDLEVIIMAQEEQRQPKFKPIVEDPGFRKIARAIRQSTVTQQYHKTASGDNTYEIRYGLGTDLHRHSRDNQEFLRALGKFLQEYSQENARVMERRKGQPYRRRTTISVEDIAQITALVDEYGAPTVASLLIAFGYASEPGTPEATVSTDADDVVPVEELVDGEVSLLA